MPSLVVPLGTDLPVLADQLISVVFTVDVGGDSVPSSG